MDRLLVVQEEPCSMVQDWNFRHMKPKQKISSLPSKNQTSGIWNHWMKNQPNKPRHRLIGCWLFGSSLVPWFKIETSGIWNLKKKRNLNCHPKMKLQAYENIGWRTSLISQDTYGLATGGLGGACFGRLEAWFHVPRGKTVIQRWNFSHMKNWMRNQCNEWVKPPHLESKILGLPHSIFKDWNSWHMKNRWITSLISQDTYSDVFCLDVALFHIPCLQTKHQACEISGY